MSACGLAWIFLNIGAGASGLLPPLGMVAQNGPARPAVRFGVRERAVKNGTATLFAMRLRACHQGKAAVNCEAVRDLQPISAILEGGVLMRPLRVGAERSETAGIFSQSYADVFLTMLSAFS